MALIKWYAVERGKSTAFAIRSKGTGVGWDAKNRNTLSARVAAGTWVMGVIIRGVEKSQVNL
jgi:hypothetical protein